MDVLEKLAQGGFNLRVMPPYERHLAVEKYNCVALLELAPDGGWRRFSSPGYLLNGQIGLLVERSGRKYFVHKSNQVAAEGEPLAHFEQFLRELDAALMSA